MNRRLLDPFQSVQLPDVVEEVLEEGVARSVAFNPRGTILAAGCEDGRIVLWDFETRGVATILEGHRKAVTGVEWSRDGRRLVSGSLDGRVICWNVEQGTQDGKVELQAMVSGVSTDERAEHICVASHVTGPPHIVDFRDGSVRPLPSVAADADARSSSATMVAAVTRSGEEVFVGQGRGIILVVDTATCRISDVIRVPGAPRILGLTLNRKGTLLLALCNDRVIRLYEVVADRGQPHLYSADAVRTTIANSRGNKGGSLLSMDDGPPPALRPLREFANAVERTGWRAAAFTPDSEHVIGAAGAPSGAAASSSGHFLYIWAAFSGRLEKVLEARASSAALALAAHPQRHLLAAATAIGQIFVWSKEYQENWSAFAPDFKELETNEEYVEREDEFDVNERPASPAADDGDEASETEVDILALDPELCGFSSDEDGGSGGGGGGPPLTHLPVVIRPQAVPAAAAPTATAQPPALTSSRKDAEQPASCAEAGGSREPLERGGRQPAGEADVGEKRGKSMEDTESDESAKRQRQLSSADP